MPEVEEAPIELAPGEAAAINRMSDAFKNARAQIAQAAKEQKPATPKPEKAQAVKAAETVTPAQPEPDHAANVDRFKAALDKAAPAEAKPAGGDPVLPAEVTGKSREHWWKMEQLLKQHRTGETAAKAELDKAKAELDALKKNGGSPEHQAQLEALRKELESRDSIIKAIAVERDPRFVQFYGQRTQAAVVEAKEAVGEQASAVVEQVFQLPPGTNRDKELEALADSLDLSDMRRVDLLAAYRNLKATEKEKAAELAKPQENFRAVQAYQQKLAAAEQERIANSRANLWQMLESEIAPDLIDADPALADSIRENVASVIAGKADADRYVAVLADAARWQRNKSIMAEQAELISKLQGQLTEIQASNPTVQSAGATERRPLPPMDNSDLGAKFKKAAYGRAA